MTKMMRSLLVLTAAVSLAGSVAFADSGEATYKAKCSSCHGATGTPSPGMAKMMGVKPVSDPSVKAMTAPEMEAIVKNGKGRMPKFDLPDSVVRGLVARIRASRGR